MRQRWRVHPQDPVLRAKGGPGRSTLLRCASGAGRHCTPRHAAGRAVHDRTGAQRQGTQGVGDRQPGGGHGTRARGSAGKAARCARCLLARSACCLKTLFFGSFDVCSSASSTRAAASPWEAARDGAPALHHRWLDLRALQPGAAKGPAPTLRLRVAVTPRNRVWGVTVKLLKIKHLQRKRGATDYRHETAYSGGTG